MATRIENKHLPVVKQKLIVSQNGICPLCKRNLTSFQSINQCVDHDHATGIIRAVLCRVCNGTEGKIKGLAIRAVKTEGHVDFIIALGEYYKKHSTPQTSWIHPTHLSEAEKRADKNKRAKKAYAAKSAAKKAAK